MEQSELENNVLAQTLIEIEHAEDRQAVVDRLCSQHPTLADKIREIAGLNDELDQRALPDESPWLPKRLGEFHVQRLIAVGGMGEIYEARQDSVNGRSVAIKVMRRSIISPKTVARFLVEPLILARLHQTNVPDVLTVGEHEGVKFYVMPFILGASLNRVLDGTFSDVTQHKQHAKPLGSSAAEMLKDTVHASNGERPTVDYSQPRPTRHKSARHAAVRATLRLSQAYLRSVAETMVQVANAIQHAHDAGIVHRDVKPSNIMVEESGRCWLIDFGLAGQLKADDSTTEAANARITLPGCVPNDLKTSTGLLGTIPYLPPEQWGGKADERSDVYGLGATLYELCTLRPPFAEVPPSDLTRIIQLPVRPPCELVSHFSPDLNDICLKAMHKSPAKRYTSAREFAQDLQRWLDSEPTKARPAHTARRAAMWSRRNPGWATAVAAMALVMFITTLAAVHAQQTQTKKLRSEFLMQRLQQVTLGIHQYGWSHETRQIADEIQRLGTTNELRDVVARTYRGIDAERQHHLRDAAEQLAYLPDGKRLLAKRVHPKQGTVELKLIELATGHVDSIPAPSFSAYGPVGVLVDGTPIQLGWRDTDRQHVWVWNVQVNQPLAQLDVPFSPTSTPLSWSLTRDGQFAGACFLNEKAAPQVVTWDVKAKAIRASFEVRSPVHSISQDGSLVAVGQEDGRIQIHSALSGETIQSFRDGHLSIEALAWGPNYLVHQGASGKQWLLAAGAGGGDVTIWDLAHGTIRSKCHGALHEIHTLMFSDDGTTLAGGGRDKPLVWDVTSGQILLELARRNRVDSCVFSPGQRQIAVSSLPAFGHPGGIDIFQLNEDRGQSVLRGLRSPIEKVRYSSQGGLIAALTHAWHLAVWDTSTRRLLRVFEVPPGMYAESAAIALDEGRQRAAFSCNKRAIIWSLVSGEVQLQFELPSGYHDEMVFTPDGRLLLIRQESVDPAQPPIGGLSRATQRVCILRDLLADDPLHPILTVDDFRYSALALRLAPDGSRAVVEGFLPPDEWFDGEREKPAQRIVKCVELPSGLEVWRIESTYPFDSPNAVRALSPAGTSVLYGSQLLSMAGGKPIAGFADDSLNGCSGVAEDKSYWVACLQHEDAQERITTSSSLFSGADNKLVLHLEHRVLTSATPFHPSARQFAMGLNSGEVVLVEIETLQAELKKTNLGW